MFSSFKFCISGEPLHRPANELNADDIPKPETDQFEESLLEDYIEERSESDYPSRPINALDVLYVNYRYLHKITNGFDKKQMIGKGGLSEVFKGITTRSKKLITVKRLVNSKEASELLSEHKSRSLRV